MDILKLAVSLLISYTAAGIGGVATAKNIPSWYAGLDKPSFNPPNWLFGPVWTLLYALMGVSLYLVWTSSSNHSKAPAFIVFAIQLILNASWSLMFFGAHRLWLAVVVIGLLLLSVIVTMLIFWQFSQPAVYLLVPYLAWICFASLLNIAIAKIN